MAVMTTWRAYFAGNAMKVHLFLPSSSTTSSAHLPEKSARQKDVRDAKSSTVTLESAALCDARERRFCRVPSYRSFLQSCAIAGRPPTTRLSPFLPSFLPSLSICPPPFYGHFLPPPPNRWNGRSQRPCASLKSAPPPRLLYRPRKVSHMLRAAFAYIAAADRARDFARRKSAYTRLTGHMLDTKDTVTFNTS